MRKLIFILLAFFAVFTYIRAFDKVEASVNSAEITIEIPAEIPVEIIR
jgi:hypothetical protein